MIVIKGDLTCLGLKENIHRFFQMLDWCQNHECSVEDNTTILTITKDGTIVEYNEELGRKMELCDIYEFYAVCKFCGSKARSNHEG